MSLTELANRKPLFSLEVFPPRKESSNKTILNTLQELQSLEPDFISVTLGAGGSGRRDATLKIANLVKNQLGVETVAHVPGLYQSKQQVLDLLDQLKSISVTNVLALRGDQIPGKQPTGDFNHANELVSFIKQNRPECTILGACYPDCHQDSPDFIDDLANLKRKVDSGTDHLITQLFFDNSEFYSFYEKARIAGITVPIEAGIMPCTNKKQIERIATITGIPVPKKFATILDRYSDNKEAMRDAGIAFAVDQIIDLVSQGVDGIHLYTMNQPEIAKRIYNETRSVFKAAVK
ncbi:methylenetetrahydrofolate reductase [NAD(P)H] [Lentilactobacillus sp. Marseille-Q4993]|uniref:methylenetetrahydrofolate reductase [NAD(P)H] n=1 Tax=Lentilactobacillus sp. Marseille-Q4993 TaxID=3039492 RepID=UPI0024BC17DC|nr:methylenetetrahydrofolate reductase [NAD(P)H] [Lentilactobacillus sp. Marseille-Q4993]